MSEIRTLESNISARPGARTRLEPFGAQVSIRNLLDNMIR
jgi:hypothetical protein